MEVPTARQLLGAWERGLDQPPVVRALLLLVEACPESSLDELAELPLATRDDRLLELRSRLFGPDLITVAACPACALELEATMSASDLRRALSPAPDRLRCESQGYLVHFRLPTSSDLIAMLGGRRLEASLGLVRRCVVEIEHEERGSEGPERLPSAVVDDVMIEMALWGKQAELELSFHCSACDESRSVFFDAATFLWQELDAWARRMLRDIATLARLYGWTEAETLGLSPTRRRLYLELSGA